MHRTAGCKLVPLSRPSPGLTPCSTRRYPQCNGPPLSHIGTHTHPSSRREPSLAHRRPGPDPFSRALTWKLHRPRSRPGARSRLGPGQGRPRRATPGRVQPAPNKGCTQAAGAACIPAPRRVGGGSGAGPPALRSPLAWRCPLRGRSGSRAPARCCPPPPPSGYRTAHINYS